MPQHLRETGLGALAERWLGAMTAHDLEAAVACFAPDHRHEAPARRGQLVHGNQPVPKEIAELFQSIPDVRAELVRTVTGDDSVRLEWRPHGTRMELAGVNILGVREDRFVWRRLYTELVRDTGGVTAEIERMTRG